MQFSKGDRDGHLVSVWHVCAISLIGRAGEVSGFYTIFEGSQSQGDGRVRLSRWPA